MKSENLFRIMMAGVIILCVSLVSYVALYQVMAYFLVGSLSNAVGSGSAQISFQIPAWPITSAGALGMLMVVFPTIQLVRSKQRVSSDALA